MKHLIFFDDTCAFCQNSVHRIIKMDRKELFAFAGLKSQAAAHFLRGDKEYLKEENSLILVENYETYSPQVWLRARAIFRILWLIGGKWKLLGWLYIVPFGTDAVYRLIAVHRTSFSSDIKTELTPKEQSRFLR